MDAAFARLTLGARRHKAACSPFRAARLEVSREAAGVARFSFAELCGTAAGRGGLSGVGGDLPHNPD